MPRGPIQPLTAPPTEQEAYQVLVARAHRRTGRVSPDPIVRHVLSITRGRDWPVQRDAFEAVVRRFEAVVAAADESRDAVAASALDPAAADGLGRGARTLALGVKVERTPGGGLVIEAPPDTASTLAALFSGMAKMLQAAADQR